MTCVLCNGNHSANYKGCTVYKQLQKTRFTNLKSKSIPVTTPNQAVRTVAVNKERNATATYSQVIQHPTDQESSISSNKEYLQNKYNKELIEMTKQLVQQITNMTNTMNNLIVKLSLLSSN